MNIFHFHNENISTVLNKLLFFRRSNDVQPLTILLEYYNITY